MTRAGRALLALLVAFAATAALSLSGAVAREPTGRGWWWLARPTGSIPSLVAPPSVPEGGLYVANAPGGPAGVSAVRFELGEGESDPVLTLQVADAVGTVTVAACKATGSWQDVQAGPWDERPASDCGTAAVTGLPSADGTTLAFHLAPLVDDGLLDVVLVPGVSADLTATAGFSVAFEKPGSGALVVDVATTTTTVPEEEVEDDEVVVEETFDEELLDVSSGDTIPSLIALPFDEPEDAVEVVAPADDLTPIATAVPSTDGFDYPLVLALPLLLLVGGAYLGWSLNRPVFAGASA